MHNEMPKPILTSLCRRMHNTVQADICQNRVAMEQVILRLLWRKIKSVMKKDPCMKLFHEVYSLYLETDTSEIGLGARLLQVGDEITCVWDAMSYNMMLIPIAPTSISLSSADRQCSNMERGAWVNKTQLEKCFFSYCFKRKVSIITDHKLLATIPRKDVTHIDPSASCSESVHTESI